MIVMENMRRSVGQLLGFRVRMMNSQVASVSWWIGVEVGNSGYNDGNVKCQGIVSPASRRDLHTQHTLQNQLWGINDEDDDWKKSYARFRYSIASNQKIITRFGPSTTSSLHNHSQSKSSHLNLRYSHARNESCLKFNHTAIPHCEGISTLASR